MSSRFCTRDRELGATLVETLLVLPLVLLLVFGIIDGARYITAKNGVHTASHEAARYGSAVGVNPDGDQRFLDCEGMRAEGMALSGGADLTASNFTITYDDGSGSALAGDCNGSDATATVSDGNRVIVTVTRDWTAVTPLVNGVFGPFTVSSVARRTILSP